MSVPKMTLADTAWVGCFLVLIVALGLGSAFLAVEYLMPRFLGSPPYVAGERLIEGVLFACGLVAGEAVGLTMVGVTSRRLVPSSTLQRWTQQWENGRESIAWPVRQMGDWMVRVVFGGSRAL